MVDVEEDKLEEHEAINITDEFVRDYSADLRVIIFIKNKFKRMSKQASINLIKLILTGNIHIKSKAFVKKPKSFVRYNISKFQDGELVPDVIKDLRYSLNGYLHKIGKEILLYSKGEHPDFKTEGDFYLLDKNSLYKNFRKLICDEGGDLRVKYNFSNIDMELGMPENVDTLQRCNIRIIGKGVKFDYPIEYEYICDHCGTKTKKKSYETASMNTRIKCKGVYNYIKPNTGEPGHKECGMYLNPDNELTITKNCYYYDICYEDKEGNNYSVSAISFDLILPGFYEVVLFKVKNPKKIEFFHVISYKETKSNKFNLPEKVNNNYLFTLVEEFDKYIKKQTKFHLYGLYPIKVALIMQTVVNYLSMKLNFNVQIVGDASTGKSSVLKYYSFLLNSDLNLSTNGLSISIPGLRGTREKVSLLGKEQSIITIGYLGTLKSIHIDEAGENKSLIQNLKTFLLEDNYGYSKAGANNIDNKRTAHINTSENIDHQHLGQYRGGVRKAYKDNTIKIGEEDKETWDEKWDLHLPLYKYENPYLHKAVKDKRMDYHKKQIFWTDGYEIPLHERFPFYFYLVHEKEFPEIIDIVKENNSDNVISNNMDLIKVLKSKDISNFFKSLIKYKDSKTDKESFNEVDIILEEYGMHVDIRTRGFYYILVKISRIINKRYNINNDDYNLLRWFLEKINCKLDIKDTISYNIVGPPDFEKEQKKQNLIDDSTDIVDDGFTMPDNEFEDR